MMVTIGPDIYTLCIISKCIIQLSRGKSDFRTEFTRVLIIVLVTCNKCAVFPLCQKHNRLFLYIETELCMCHTMGYFTTIKRGTQRALDGYSYKVRG